jgi:hypothetical protein
MGSAALQSNNVLPLARSMNPVMLPVKKGFFGLTGLQ